MRNKLILMFFLFFLFPFCVRAASDNEHIYAVESFNVYDNYINVSGYSFISHRDNWGGKNLDTYLVAYLGSWNNSYINCSDSSSNCLKISASETDRNFWNSRCTNGACLEEQTVIEQVKRGNWSNTSACNSSGTRSGLSKSGASCLYYNVGFSAKIEFDSLYKKFNSSGNSLGKLKFRVVSSINSGNNMIVSSDMGVYRKICKFSNGNSCSDGVISAGNYQFQLGKMSDIAYYDATTAKVKDINGNTVVKPNTELAFAAEKQCGGQDCNYRILDVITSKDICYHKAYVAQPLCVKGMFFKLQAKWNGRVYSSPIGNVYPYDGNVTESYWTAGDRIRIVGSLEINNLAPNVIEKKCNDLFPGEKIDKNEVNCGNDGKYNQCKKVDRIIGEIYYPSPSCNNSDKCPLMPDGKRYVKVKVETKVLFAQEGTFTFGKVSPTTVRAGKGFSLGNTTYDNKIVWAIALLKYEGSPYYKYSKSWGRLPNGSFGDIDIDTSGSQMVYYKNIDGNYIKTNLSTASFEAISLAVSKYINKDKINDSVHGIKVVSCDSNNSSDCGINNPNYMVKGSWNIEESNMEDFNYNRKKLGKIIENKYKYQLANSCVIVNGSQAKNVIYGDNTDSTVSCNSTGQVFYSDFNWDTSKYLPFNLKGVSNPSLISDSVMKWELNGSCKINVVPGITPSPEGKLYIKYRSIDVSNPFPKGVTSKNWIDWYKVKNNQLRISNSYNNGIFYSVTLSKLGNNGTVKISDINNIVRHYKDMTGITVDGYSDFIKQYFNDNSYITDKKSFCELGSVDSSCDTLVKVGG